MTLEEFFTGHGSFWHRRFHVGRHYGRWDIDKHDYTTHLRYGNTRPFICKYYGRDIFIQIIIADYKLRMNAQQQERIKRKIDGACTPSDSNKDMVKDLHGQLYNVRLEWNDVSYKLYEAESMLDTYSSKHNYEHLHKKPRWYMRKKLITDCVGRDGCCSRGCGCCALRATKSYERGTGHCTVECSCCVSHRGSEPTRIEKAEIFRGMKSRLENKNAAYLLNMANAYFSKP